MQTRDFCFWLRGFIEINNPETITPQQLKTIKEHLDKVFVEVNKPVVMPTIFPYTPQQDIPLCPSINRDLTPEVTWENDFPPPSC